MKKEEKNILIIDTQNNKNLKSKLLELNSLEKIEKIILIENNFKEYFFQILYRIFIYPFRRKRKIRLFIDGFEDHIPLFLANLGKNFELIFYEEGESLYLKQNLFKKTNKYKKTINTLIKKLLFSPKSSLKKITRFYVRDKKRFFKLLEENNYKPNFEVIEVNEDKELKNISTYDKELLKNIFLSKVNVEKNNNKKAIILTQPLYFDNPLSKEESIKIFNDYIKKLQTENYEIYIKLHPRESQDDNYIKENVKRIKGEFPFELLTLLDINFDIGVTYNSTAINCNFINKKILLKNIIDMEKK